MPSVSKEGFYRHAVGKYPKQQTLFSFYFKAVVLNFFMHFNGSRKGPMGKQQPKADRYRRMV